MSRANSTSSAILTARSGCKPTGSICIFGDPTKNRSSALGTYSIDKAGDTSLAPYIFSRVKGGKLVAFKGLIVP